MSPQDLQDIVDRHGEDPERWPAPCRAPARELIDVCVEAKEIIAQARRLRVELRSMGPDAPECFTDHIVTLALELDPPMDDVIWFRN